MNTSQPPVLERSAAATVINAIIPATKVKLSEAARTFVRSCDTGTYFARFLGLADAGASSKVNRGVPSVLRE